jgi:quercetin dioxygenase-like cupin family protein
MSEFLISPQDGQSIWLGGLGVHFKVASEQTGGSFSIVEHPIEPGLLIRPHMHAHEDEFSYVLEGEVGARIGNQELLATPGCYIVKPRGVLHTFWNAGPKPARLIEIISPAGFEQYFAELAELVSSEGPDFEKIAQLSNRYGITYDMEWVPELTAKYNLHI